MAKIAASGRLGLVGAVGIGARDEGMPLVRLLEQGHRAIAVLHIGRTDQYDKGATIGIDHCMAFSSHGLLACVVTTRSSCSGGLHAIGSTSFRESGCQYVYISAVSVSYKQKQTHT